MGQVDQPFWLRRRQHRDLAIFAAVVARTVALLPGLLATIALAAVATALGRVAPIVGSPVIAIVAGIGIALVRQPSARMRPGLRFASKSVLQGSIILLGAGLSFSQVFATGASSLPVLLGTLTVALVGAWLLGRVLSVSTDLRTLIGVGTGICGASAIAATDAVISASQADVSYAIATIFTFNVVAVLTFPTLGHLLTLAPHSFGLWAGTAVNDMSSVVAAASIFGHGATADAVVVKLTRTLMIIPICVVLAVWRGRRGSSATRSAMPVSRVGRVRRILPIFIGWFLVAVSLNTLGLVPRSWHGTLAATAQVLITIALAGIGLSTRLQDIRRAGLRPLALGGMLWFLVGTSSLGLQLASGTLH
ncbi:MAG TPA: putative sulfate exporter family transporter [Candidatus Micrarchaeaceae archaeon]|nr:putative sulfate exporter family transporter [Candidatus Micrarchaeaceae archaeon]